MEQIASIINDAVVRATDRCEMTCDVDGDELRFEFEYGIDNGLQLAFDWPGFVRCMRVASTVMELLRAIPAGAPIDFEVTADDDANADIIAALRLASGTDTWIPVTFPSPSENVTGTHPDKTEEQQFASTRIASYPYVIVTRRCALTYRVQPDEIQLRFGDNNIGLQFYLNFIGFAKFMRVASNMVTRLRATPHGARINFKVWDNNDERHEQANTQRTDLSA
jgi:hypothetical protein